MLFLLVKPKKWYLPGLGWISHTNMPELHTSSNWFLQDEVLISSWSNSKQVPGVSLNLWKWHYIPAQACQEREMTWEAQEPARSWMLVESKLQATTGNQANFWGSSDDSFKTVADRLERGQLYKWGINKCRDDASMEIDSRKVGASTITRIVIYIYLTYVRGRT